MKMVSHHLNEEVDIMHMQEHGILPLVGVGRGHNSLKVSVVSDVVKASGSGASSYHRRE